MIDKMPQAEHKKIMANLFKNCKCAVTPKTK